MNTGFHGATPVNYPDDMAFGLPNCGLVAMSIVTGASLTETTEWYRTHAKPRGNWRGAIRHIHCGDFLRLKGKWFVHVKYNSRERVRTIGDFAEWHTKPNTFYMVRSSGHMMVCYNGWIIDQHDMAPANRHWCRNKRLKDAWEIL